MSEKKCLFGLPQNILAALSYVGVFITGILVFIFERENKFVRFHALQSTILFGALAIVDWIVGLLWVIPLIGGVIGWAFNVVCVVIYVYMIYSAYKGNLFKVPILGDIVWEQVNKE